MNVTRGSSQPYPPGLSRNSYGVDGSSASPMRRSARVAPRPARHHARIDQHFSVAIARRCRMEAALAFGFVVVGLECDPEPLHRCLERRERKLIHHVLVYLRTVDAIVTPSGVTTSITEPVR